MSVRRMGSGNLGISAQGSTGNLAIPAASTRVCKNGIEFRAEQPIAVWTEMTLEFFSPLHDRRLHCRGVVVSCSGNRHEGFRISMIFTSISEAALDMLIQLHPPTIGN